MAYDLFGNGRTAIKSNLGRYVAKTNVDVAVLLNPITTSVNTASRSWNDVNLDFVPDCDLGNFGQNGECGPLDNQNFGKSNPNAVRWSDDVREGWGTRDYNWEFGTEVQHELTRGLSVNGGYYFNTGGYFRNTDSAQRVNNNLAVGTPTSTTSASRPRAIHACPAAAAIRSVVSRTSNPRNSGSLRCSWNRIRPSATTSGATTSSDLV